MLAVLMRLFGWEEELSVERALGDVVCGVEACKKARLRFLEWAAWHCQDFAAGPSLSESHDCGLRLASRVSSINSRTSTLTSAYFMQMQDISLH